MGDIFITNTDEASIKDTTSIALKLAEAPGRKNIPKNWYKEIIQKNISEATIKPIHSIVNTDSAEVIFDSEKKTEDFYLEINSNMIKCINAVIASHNEEPTNFNRAFVLESKVEGLKISFVF